MSEWMLRDYLVFEASEEPVPAYTCFFTPHSCVGHVRAEDEVGAAQVVAGLTGRVRKYAVVDVTVVDLGSASPQGRDLIDDVGDTPHRV